MRNRWLMYIAVGLVFGIADWYFLDLLASLDQDQALSDNLFKAPAYIRSLIVIVLVASNYGVWLVPVIPVAIYEMKRSRSLRRAAISAVIVWSAAMLSYYAYYAFMLMFVGLPNMDFMLFTNHQSVSYWENWWGPFRRVILNQIMEWIGIAIIGGAIVGTISAYVSDGLVKRVLQRRSL